MSEDRGTVVDDRLLGRIDGDPDGPVLLCVAGIHGNEPAGVHAVRRVLTALEGRESEMAGSVVALAGNMTALEAGRRFVDRDLNRAWTATRLAGLRRGGSKDDTVEDREQIELLGQIEEVLDDARGPVFALDLHTTSGPGGIFCAFTDALPHRDFATGFPIPMIFGLEELVDGTLLNLLSEQGVVALTVETGQHDDPAAIDLAEAAIWIALASSGVLPGPSRSEADGARKLLKRATSVLPRALEMRYKHDVRPGDGFTMKPGFSNFDTVAAGEVVAREGRGEIAAAEGGRLLMPLYQEQGEDGFFLVREFLPFWMGVSTALRRARVSRFATMLPGVSRGLTEDEVVIDKRIARWFARQLFHLMGYRQMDASGSRLVMRRRRFDERCYVVEPPRPQAPIEALPGARGDDAGSVGEGRDDASGEDSRPSSRRSD